MGIRSWVQSGLTLAVIGIVVVILLGQVLGQPIGLGFVVTGSMEPTLAPGDGFVAIPPPLAGDIEAGDVVTFDAEELQGGGLTTHRVVRETEQGYITRGDANPFTDQEGGEPIVRDSDIVAVALQVNGEVVVIPGLGDAVTGLQGLFESGLAIVGSVPGLGLLTEGGFGSVMIGIGVLVLALSVVGDLLLGQRRGKQERSRRRGGVVSAGVILAVIILLIVVPATLSMVIPSGANEIQVISSTSPTEDPTIIPRGGSQEMTYNGTNSGFIPRVVVIEPGSEGVEVSNRILVLGAGESGSTKVTISVPEETGAYTRVLSIHHYVQVLPTSVIVSLHEIHPWVAVVMIDLFLATLVTIIYVLTIGLSPIRFRSTARDISFVDRLKRYLP